MSDERMKAILEGLKETQSNGRLAIGLEGATEKALPSDLYTAVPDTYGEPGAIYSPDPNKCVLYKVVDGEKEMPSQLNSLSTDDILQVASLNYKAISESSVFEGESESLIELATAAKLAHILYGWIGMSRPQEIRFAKKLSGSDLLTVPKLEAIRACLPRAMLLVVSAALSYYQTNHHMGGPRLTGIMLKTVKQIGLMNKDGTMPQKLYEQVYAMVHAPDKRTILYLLLPPNANNSMAREPCWPLPPRIDPDMYLSLRTTTFPAGTHKLTVSAEIIKQVVSYGVLPIMPGYVNLSHFYGKLRQVSEAGFAAHQGARYLLEKSEVQPVLAAQNDSIVTEVFTACSIFAVKVMGGSTLSQSPAVQIRANEAASMYQDWTSLCESLAGMKLTASAQTIAKALMSYSMVDSTFKDRVDELSSIPDSAPDKAEKQKALGRDLKTASKKMMEEAIQLSGYAEVQAIEAKLAPRRREATKRGSEESEGAGPEKKAEGSGSVKGSSGTEE